MANDPQVAVRFAVKDAEVVRNALQNLGKDGEAALKRFDAAAKPVPKSLTAVSDVVSELKGRAVGSASSLGLLGTGLLGLGATGLVAAAALGGIYLAFQAIADGSKAFGLYAREVREFSQTTGFSVTQVQALTDVFAKHGIEEEKARAGLERLTTERAKAAKGTGELYTELRRLNPALAEEFASAKSAGDAFEILTRAIGKVDGPTQALLSKFGFGKGGVAFAQALLDIAGRGGLGAIEAAAIKTGAALDASVIDKQAKAADAAEAKARLVERAWNGAYASIYNIWKDFKKTLGLDENGVFSITVALTLQKNADFVRTKLFGAGNELEKALAERDKAASDLEAARAAPKVPALSLTRARQVFTFQNPPDQAAAEERLQAAEARVSALMVRQRAEAVRAERSVPVQEGESEVDRQQKIDKLTRQIEVEKERIALLGAAATPTEQLRLKTDELNLAVLKNAKLAGDAARALSEQNRVKDAATLTAREQLGLATEADIRKVLSAKLDHDYSNGYIKDAAERAIADKIASKEARDRANAVEVKASDFPALTRLKQESGDLRTQIDNDLSGAVRGVTSDILAMAKGTETASQAFGNMAIKITDAIAQAILMKTVVGPLSSSLLNILPAFFGGNPAVPGAPGVVGGAGSQSVPTFPYALGDVFGGGLSGLGPYRNSVVDRPTLFKFASGVGLTGEAGPEAIIPLRRDSSGRLGVSAGGAGGVNVNVTHIVNDHSGTGATSKTTQSGNNITIETFIPHIESIMADRINRGRGALFKATDSRTGFKGRG